MIDLSAPVGLATLAIVDVETTGLWAEQGARVCELAVLRVESARVVDNLVSLVNPGRPIEPDAGRVNGLSDADVAKAPRFHTFLPRLDELLSGAVLVAHNTRFDVSFLVAEYAIAGHQPPDVPVLDTLALSRKVFGFRRNDLGSVAMALGAPLGQMHRAAGDAETTLHVILRMAESLAERGMRTVGDLLAAQSQTVELRPARRSDLPAPLDDAVSRRLPVTICYVDAGGHASERVVEPLWVNRDYLIAFCRTRKEQRTFRLDRIVDAWSNDVEAAEGGT